jgi:hypothetical protein
MSSPTTKIMRCTKLNDFFNFRYSSPIKMKLIHLDNDLNKRIQFKNIVNQHKVFQNERVINMFKKRIAFMIRNTLESFLG